MRVVFFDIDGTLLMTNGAGKKAIESCLSDHFKVNNPNADIDYGGRTDMSLIRELFQLNGLKEPTIDDISLFFGDYVARLKAELQISGSTILPGVAQLLSALEADDRYELGIITGNIEEGAEAKLSHHNIQNFFRFGGYGNRMPKRDDIAREGLAAAEDHLDRKLDGKQCLVIGDTPHDIICSRAIGAYSVAVGTGYSNHESLLKESPTMFFENLADTQQVLRSFDELF